jgi:DNA-directed RNA polymerase specialized sigma24 family protein
MAGDGNEVGDLNPSPNGGGASSNQSILMLRREVGKLKPALQSMIKQYYGTERSLEESAKAVDISLGSAKSRLMRGRKTLRSYLKRHDVSNSGVY